jgi:YVTN family beta-propeller protein
MKHRSSSRFGWLFSFVVALSAQAADLLIVLNKSDDTASILDAKTGVARGTVSVGHAPHEAEVLADLGIVAVSNYGTRESAGHTLSLIDPDKMQLVGSVELGEGARPHGMRTLPNGQLLVTAEGKKELLIVDPKERRVVSRIPTGQDVGHMVVRSLDGKRAFVTNIGSGSVTVVDLVGKSVIKNIQTGKGSEGIDITPDGKEIWVTNRAEDTVSIVDSSSLSILSKVKVSKFPIRVKITPDGKQALVSCAQSGDVVVLDVAQRRELKRIPTGQEAVSGSENRLLSGLGRSPAPVGILIAPDGKRAWVASTNADVISEINLESLSLVRRLVAGKEPDGLAGVFGAGQKRF